MALPKLNPDRAALVTGASSGIGEAIARELADRGRTVILVARTEELLSRVAEDLRSGGNRVEVLPTDLSVRGARAELPGRVAALGLELDILVNNAGFSTVGPIGRSDPDAELEMIEVDVAAVADLCSRFLPGMLERKEGAILNVASTAAFQPLPGQAGYGASKAFVLSYTQALRGELRGRGVVATALCPGPVDTRFAERAGLGDLEDEAPLPKFMWESPESVAKVGIEALSAGHGVAIPGVANRATAAFARFAPRSVLVPLIAKNHPGMRT